MAMKRIGVLTSGGDAPGMNAAIRAVVRCAAEAGVETVAFRGGYRGLLTGNSLPLGLRDVGGILTRGGTILGSGRVPEFCRPDAPAQAIAVLCDLGVDGLVVIGGDHTTARASTISASGAGNVALIKSGATNTGFTFTGFARTLNY